MPRRSFLAWEIGGGLGHVMALAVTARVLQRRGFVVCAYLAQLENAAELAPFCESVEQSPQLSKVTDNPARSTRIGFGGWLRLVSDPNTARFAIEQWRKLMIEAQPSIVVCDFSPSAILAARSLEIPVVRIGVPMTTPPAQMPSLSLSASDKADPHSVEDRTRDSINRAISTFGMAPLPTLPSIFTVDDDIVASLELLDPYAAWRSYPRIPPIMGNWQDPGERRREEVFVYLSDRERFNPVILAAIASLDLPSRVLVMGNAEAAATAARWRNTKTVEQRPLPPREIIRRTKVLVHAGAHGICCLGLRAGIPQVTFPDHAERLLNSRRLASQRAATVIERPRWTVPNIQAAIREAWENAAVTDHAIKLAKEFAPEFEGDPGEMIGDRIEALLH